MQVSIIGAGYVGLVTAACLADVGNTVLCIDVDAGKIERLRRSQIPVHEPELDRLVERNTIAGRLQFSTNYDDAVAHATLISLLSEHLRVRMARQTCRTYWRARASWACASNAILWWSLNRPFRSAPTNKYAARCIRSLRDATLK